MDRGGGAKRPRSKTPTKGAESCSGPPPKKKSKDKSRKKKSKANRENRPSTSNDEDKTTTAPAATSHESVAQHPRTASPNGQRMSQILSTFSSVEHSRWEAYRRVVFPGDAIEQYVAFLLREHMIRRHGQRPTSTSTTTNTTTHSKSLQLRDLVVPQQAHEIGLVVSTLAKAYAQRLVTAAIAERNNNNNNNSCNNNCNEPLAPHYILKAHETRQALGLDPGFFLQARQDYQMITSTTTRTPNMGTDDIERLAALAAQEEYDQQHPTTNNDDDNKNNNDDNNNNNNNVNDNQQTDSQS